MPKHHLFILSISLATEICQVKLCIYGVVLSMGGSLYFYWNLLCCLIGCYFIFSWLVTIVSSLNLFFFSIILQFQDIPRFVTLSMRTTNPQKSQKKEKLNSSEMSDMVIALVSLKLGCSQVTHLWKDTSFSIMMMNRLETAQLPSVSRHLHMLCYYFYGP